MHLSTTFVASMMAALPVLALPAKQSPLKSALTAVPGESNLFLNYMGRKTPLASNYTKAIPAMGSGPAGEDDVLFQNLLAAEWIIYSFYQEAVKKFNTTSFTDLGYPNTTYERVLEMRNNEAGHVRIFQDQISDNSVKPGPCKYQYAYNDPASWLAFQTYLETASMAYLTGLILQADLDISKSALLAVGFVEARHTTWSQIDIWNDSPFAGPTDTMYPYANQILDTTTFFMQKGSCPSDNPSYPSPSQGLHQMGFVHNETKAHPGSKISFRYFTLEGKVEQPNWNATQNYFATFYHGVNNISVPYDPKKNSVTIPKEFDSNAGAIIVNIANEAHVPTQDSVVAGPLVLLEQPAFLTNQSPTNYL